jgi:hypothetical protein
MDNSVKRLKKKIFQSFARVARMREWRGVYRVFAAKPEGKSPLRKARRSWEDNNNKMHLREEGSG